MSTVNVNVVANGLNSVLASMIQMQNINRDLVRSLRGLTIPPGAPQQGGPTPPGGGIGGSGGGNLNNRGGSGSNNLQAIRDTARRESGFIVAAYAEVASTIFATTAAFNALKNAAQFGTLLTAQRNFAKETGTNMQSVARSLQEVSRYAVSFQEATQFASIGRLAGFTTKQVKELTQTGLSAATILGRDIPDALSRMFRGVAKGEPEILDELGIFIRLDNAYKAYVKSHAIGQKVFELSAYQRRQATFYAAQEAGRQMREGNKDIEPDEFTKAGAKFATTFKEGMLSLANTVAPVVKIFADNTELLLAALAMLFRTPLRNLGNVLVNETRAKNKLEADRLRTDELKTLQEQRATQGRELRNQNSATISQLRTKSQIEALNRDVIRLDQDSYDKRLALMDKYQKAIIKRLHSNNVSDAEKTRLRTQLATLSPDNVMGFARANGNINNSVRAALGEATIAHNAAVAAQNRAAETLPITWKRAGTIIRTEISSITARLGVATAAAARFNTAISTAVSYAAVGFTKFLGAVGSLGTAVAMLYMFKEGLSAIGDYSGLTSGKVSDLAGEFGSASKRIDDTLSSLDKLNSPKNSNDAIRNAEIISNIYDSLSTDIDSLQKKMKGINFGEWKIGAGDVENFNKVIRQSIPLLDTAAKDRVRKAALSNLDTAYQLQQSAVGITVRDLKGKSYTDLSNAMAAERDKVRNILLGSNGIQNILDKGIVLPIATSKAALKQLAVELAKSGEGAKLFSESLKSASQAVQSYNEALDTMAKTAVDESPFNEMLDKLKLVKAGMLDLSNKNKLIMPDIGFVVSNSKNKTVAKNMLSQLESSFAQMKDFVASMPGGKSRFVTAEDLLPSITGDDGKDAIANYKKFLLVSAKIEQDYTNQMQAGTAKRNKWLSQQGKQRTADIMSDITKDNLARKYDVASLFSAAKEIGDIYSELAKRRGVTESLKELGPGTDLSGAFSIALADTSLALQNADKSAVALMSKLKALKSTYEFTSKSMGVNLRVSTADADTLYKSLLQAMNISSIDGSTNKQLSALARQLADTANNSALLAQEFKDKNIDLVTETNLTTAITTAMNNYNRELSVREKLERQLSMAKQRNVYYDAEAIKATKLSIDQLETINSALYKSKLAVETFNPALSISTIITNDLNDSMLALGDSVATAFQPQVLAEFVQRTRQALRQIAIAKATTTAEIGITAVKTPDVPTSALSTDLVKIRELYTALGNAKEALKQGTITLDEYTVVQEKLTTAEQKYTKSKIDEAVRLADAESSTRNWTKELEQLTKSMRKSTLLSAWSGFVDDAVAILANGKGSDGTSAAKAIRNSGLDRLTEWSTKNIKASQEAAFKGLGKNAKEAFEKSDIFSGLNKLKTDFPKTVGALSSALPYIGQLISNRNDRNARVVSGAGLLGSGAGFGLASLFGVTGPVGAAVGGAIGSMLGSVFTKKVKEVGAQINVSMSGIATGVEAELIKRTALSSSSKLKYGSAIDSEIMSQVQDTVTKMRESYRVGLAQFNQLTGGSFGNQSVNTAAFSKNYMQKADQNGDIQTLIKGFSKDFGNWIASNQEFLVEFQDATESLADTLIRLVDTMKVTDSAFTTLFGLNTSSIVDKGAVDSYITGMSKTLVTDIRGTYEANVRASYNGDSAILGTAYANKLISTYNDLFGRAFNDVLSNTVSSDTISSLDTLYANAKANIRTGAEQTIQQARVADLKRIAEYFYNGANATELVTKAQQSFYDAVVKAFDGADINAKREAYNAALSTYTGVASSSIIALSDSLSNVVMNLNDYKVNGITAITDGKLKPIAEFNKDLRAIIANGASAEEIGKALKLGANLAAAINNILDAFASVDISKATNASSFASTVSDGINTTFKQSAIDTFKKGLLAPLYADVLDAVSTGTFTPTTEEYSSNSAPIIQSAKRMVTVLGNSEFKASLNAISLEFEKLIKVLSVAESVAAISDNFTNISKDMKLAAYSFAVDGNQTSIALFKAMEALKAAGVSADIAKLPLGQAVDKLKALAANGEFSTDALNNVNEALKAMADYSLQARDEIAKLNEVSMKVYDATSASIRSIAYAIIEDSDSLDAAKAAITSLMTISGDKVAAAKSAYEKAQVLGNNLAIEEKALTYANAVDESMQLQVEYLGKLSSMTKAKYESEKAALDTLNNAIKGIKDLAEDIKFDEVLSILKPTDRLKASELSFEELKRKVLLDAKNGGFTEDTLAKFQEESRRLLELGRDVYASGDAYTALYNEVMSSLNQAATDAAAQVLLKEAELKKYQDESLAYAKQSRDIQYASLGVMSELSRASVVDNAISVDLLNAIRYNSGLPQGLALNDYYNKLFLAAQSSASSFTTPGSGYAEFNGIGSFNAQNTQQQEIINAKVTEVLDKLTVVLANLPVDVKNAIQSTTNLTTRRN